VILCEVPYTAGRTLLPLVEENPNLHIYFAPRFIFTGFLEDFYGRYGPMDDVDMYNHPFVDADGKVVCLIGVTRPHVVTFDPRSRKFTSQVPLPGEPLDLGLQDSPGGKIYGSTSSCIYRLDPSTFSLEVVVMAEGAFTVPGPILGRHIYFATGHRLRAAEVF